MVIKPCIKCKSENTKILDCGYSSFNPRWVICIDCGHEVKKNRTTYNDQDGVSVWNQEWEDNEFVIDLQRLRKENEDLKKEVNVLAHRISDIVGQNRYIEKG